jgi:hypothetical protein
MRDITVDTHARLGEFERHSSGKRDQGGLRSCVCRQALHPDDAGRAGASAGGRVIARQPNGKGLDPRQFHLAVFLARGVGFVFGSVFRSVFSASMPILRKAGVRLSRQ